MHLGWADILPLDLLIPLLVFIFNFFSCFIFCLIFRFFLEL